MPEANSVDGCGMIDPSSATAASISSTQPSKDNPWAPPLDRETYTWRLFWKKFFNAMTEDEAKRYHHNFSVNWEEQLCKTCDERRDWLFKNSPIINFLNDNIKKLGVELNSENVLCRRCDTMAPGGMKKGAFSEHLGILLCANHLSSKGETEDVLAHEMVHAYDYMRFQFDRKNLKHHACTEIRANALSGECRWLREFWGRSNWKFTAGFQDCVKRRAALAVKMHPSCENDAHANRIVKEVWQSCFNDTRPFDEIYR